MLIDRDLVVATQDCHPAAPVSFASAHPGRRILDVVSVYAHPQVLWPDQCVGGTPGAALDGAVPDRRLALILRKGTRREVDSYSAFREQPGPDGTRTSTGLGAWLHARGVSRVFIVGLARDYCVNATAVDAQAEGFRTFVLDDLTRAVAPEWRHETDEAWRRAGVGVVMSDVLQD